MRWLTIDELRRVLREAGVPVARKTITVWARVPGTSRLIANRRMFDPRVPQLLVAGHDLMDIAAALRNGASPHELEQLPPAPSRRGNPRGNPRKRQPERPADADAAA